MGMKNVDEQEKLEARKMPDREACRTPEGQSHTSSACFLGVFCCANRLGFAQN